MINADIRNLFVDNINDEEIKKASNDIYIYILISLVVICLQIESLITQYVVLLLCLFIFSIRTGILYASVLFFCFNYSVFSKHPILRYVVLANIVISLIMIIIEACIDTNQYLFISLIIFNIATILSNIYCIYVITSDSMKSGDNIITNILKSKTEDNKKDSIGGINIKNINFNYRK
ncbi:hypothetical protein Yalta_076 [Yalta virus]|nr:hypothetical protein Yalta_076 [Yalta virus]